MDKQDIDAARGSLTQVSATLGPILQAMAQADTVFSVLANAEKHKAALLVEVDTLQKGVAELQATASALQATVQEAADAANQAEAQARDRVKAAQTAADALVAEVEKGTQAQISAAQAAAADKVGSFANSIADAQKAHDERMASLFSASKAAETDAAAVEKKLAALRDAAKKFAATLTSE